LRRDRAERRAVPHRRWYAIHDLPIDGHRETWPLRSKRFQAWLRQHYYERTWDAPSPAALNAALNALEAQAQFDGPQRKVSLRLAEQDGLIYLDLADEFLALRRNRRQRMADRRGPSGQVPPQRRHAATSAPAAGWIN